MVSYCCVKGCNNNSNSKKKDPSSLVSFHAFPSNTELKTKWLRAIGRPNWVPPSHSRICSAHFNHDQINYEGCRIRIKDDAVPENALPPNSNFEASHVETCRICLATDLRMYSLQESQLANYIESIPGFNDNQNLEGLPQFICYQCAACLKKYNKLIEKSMIAQATLLDIFAKNGQITKTLIKEQNRAKLNLMSSLSCFQTTNIYYFNYDNIDKFDNLQCFNNIEVSKNLKKESDSSNSNEIVHLKIDKEYKETEKYENGDDEINDADNYDENRVTTPIDDNFSDNEHLIKENIEENTKYVKTKVVTKRHETFRSIKQKTKKVNSLTPDEIEMQKYFDIRKLAPLEQIEEWKRMSRKRSLVGENVYECKICGKLFAHVATYRLHLISHDDSRGKAECPVCKLRFKNEMLVRSHINRAHAKSFHCRSCPKVFHNVGVAKKHQRWHFGYKYKCPTCPFSTAHESALGVHVRRTHQHVHVCALCARACVSARGLLMHMATAHRNVKTEDITKTYRCEQCNIDFVSEGARRVHLLTSKQHKTKNDLCDPTPQDNKLRNACSKCGIQCVSFSDLVTHTRTEHPRPKGHWRLRDYPTDCEICGESMASRKKHWHHVRKHHPKQTDTYKPVITAVCDTCGKGFQNSTKLHLHKLRHSNPTVRCALCPRLFYDKYALSRHRVTHNNEKPYRCGTCERAFSIRTNLQRHAKVHTDVTPYECTMCNKKFKYSSSVNLHVRTVHYKLPHPHRKKKGAPENIHV